MDQSVDVSRLLIQLQEPTSMSNYFSFSSSSSSGGSGLRIIATASLHLNLLLLKMSKFLFDSVKVEVVSNELVIDLAEKLMILVIAEPVNPAAR